MAAGRSTTPTGPGFSTLQGKAKEVHDRHLEVAKPQGYKLEAMIIDFPGGMPGDVGLFLDWAP